MKSQAIHYLGLEVHQATAVASVRNDQGVVVMRATVRTDADTILGLVRTAGPRVHVAFEEGTQAQWLHDVLQPHAERVIVCNVRGKSEVTNKSDRSDADDLSEKLRLGSLKPVYHGTPRVLTLKELVRNYNSLVEDATRVMPRIKALFRARAIRTPGTSVYRAARRKEWLGQLTTPGARVRAATLLEQLDLLLKLRPKAKAAMIAEARKMRAGSRCGRSRFSAVYARRNCWPASPHRIRSEPSGTCGLIPAWLWSRDRVPIRTSPAASFAGERRHLARAV